MLNPDSDGRDYHNSQMGVPRTRPVGCVCLALSLIENLRLGDFELAGIGKCPVPRNAMSRMHFKDCVMD